MGLDRIIYNIKETSFEGMKLYSGTTIKDQNGDRHKIIVQPRFYAFTRMIGEVFVYEHIRTNIPPVVSDIRQYIKNTIRN